MAGSLLTDCTAPDTPTPDYSLTPAQRKRNRHAMLELVKNAWIKGVLEQSLRGAALIELRLEERPDVVEQPWDMMLQTGGQPNRLLSRGTKIIDVYDGMNGALLILDEPGSVKWDRKGIVSG